MVCLRGSAMKTPATIPLLLLGSILHAPQVGAHVGCTTIAVGRDASTDGSTMCTHNADCLDCDFRLGKVPAADWPEGSMRTVYAFRAQFPRVVDASRGYTWSPENLDPWLQQRTQWLSQEWTDVMVMGHIPQVNHTYASLEGLYGIINEKQVGIGESTAGSRWYAGPNNEDCAVCNAMFDVSELSRIAMERASTAREAIQLMGDLAVEYGFYGSEWDDNPFSYVEGGEVLTVTDPDEVWVFHILPDDSTTSAVWAAQRVPDGHVTVIANQFVIRQVHKDSADFMYSDNLWDVAQRNGLWSPGDEPLDFTATYAARPNDFPHYAYSTRRVWRVMDKVAPSNGEAQDQPRNGYDQAVVSHTYFTRRRWRVMDKVAPSLGLAPYTDFLGSDYPFSVKPDSPVSAQDVLELLRDHYEGTPFDMTKGLMAGPFGDVDRYDAGVSLDGSMKAGESSLGFLERSISLFRTSYSFVTQSRRHLPDEVGAMIWYAPYKPSAATYVPVYVSTKEIPRPYAFGSLFKYTPESAFWAFCSVSNWMAKYRRHIHPEVAAAQQALEDPLKEQQEDLETKAAALVRSGDTVGAVELLTEHSDRASKTAVDTFNDMFQTFIARWHDGYRMEDPGAEIVNMEKLFYPKAWLEAAGFFSSLQRDALATAITQKAKAMNAVTWEHGWASGVLGSRLNALASSSQDGTNSWILAATEKHGLHADVYVMFSVLLTACAAVFTGLSLLAGRFIYKRTGYTSITV